MTRIEWLLIGGLAFLVIYEVIALVRRSPTTPTISRIVWDATTQSALVPLGFGLLMGHFFWTRECVQVVARLW